MGCWRRCIGFPKHQMVWKKVDEGGFARDEDKGRKCLGSRAEEEELLYVLAGSTVLISLDAAKPDQIKDVRGVGWKCSRVDAARIDVRRRFAPQCDSQMGSVNQRTGARGIGMGWDWDVMGFISTAKNEVQIAVNERQSMPTNANRCPDPGSQAQLPD